MYNVHGISVRADMFENCCKRYGVAFYNQNNEVVEKFDDVFVQRADAETFVQKCNATDLSFEHIYDVLEDFLE